MKSLQQRLSRITEGRHIIPEIEGLRFISIVLVALSHINNNLLKNYPADKQNLSESRLGIFLEQCGAGVSIFFFISGFILSIPFLQDKVYHLKKVSIKHYYYRRLTRIEPPYLISLTIFLALAIVVLHQPPNEAFQHYGASAFYIHNIAYNHISTINPVAWTLEIEVQFYLLFPLVAVALFVENVLIRRLLLLSFFLLSAYLFGVNYLWFDEWHLTKSVFAYLNLFATGMIAADLYLQYKDLLNNKHWLWDVLGIVSLYFILTLSGYQSIVIKTMVFACYLIFLTAMFKSKFIHAMATSKWIVIIGGMCYSIYLVHYATIFIVTELFAKQLYTYKYGQDVLTQTLILLPCILLVSAIFFILLEKPFMNPKWPQQVQQFLKRKLH